MRELNSILQDVNILLGELSTEDKIDRFIIDFDTNDYGYKCQLKSYH